MKMYKFAKIVCNSILNYRNVHSKTLQKVFTENIYKTGVNTRLCVFQKITKEKSPYIIYPSNVAIALSILTWMGFTEDDKDKDSELIMTLKRAVLCTQREQYDKAEQMLHIALRIAQQEQNMQGVLYCYDLMANLAFDQYELNKAEKLFVTILQMLLSSNVEEENLKVIHVSLKLARICQLQANIERAEMGYNWCLAKIEKQRESSTDAQILYGVINDWYAQFLLDKGDIKKSLIHLQEAYRVCSETKGKNSEQCVLLLNDLGITSFRAEDLDNAIKYLKEAIHIGEGLEDKAHLGVVHANLGLVFLQKGIFEQAEKLCKEAWHLGNKHSNNESIEQANYCFDQIKLNMKK